MLLLWGNSQPVRNQPVPMARYPIDEDDAIILLWWWYITGAHYAE